MSEKSKSPLCSLSNQVSAEPLTDLSFKWTNNDTDYIIAKATKSDFNKIHEFLLGDFLKYEPLNEALDVCREDAEQFFGELVRCCLEEDASFIVYQPSDESGKIAAICLNCIINRPKAKSNTTSACKFTTQLSPKMQKIEKLLKEMEDKTWEYLPVDKSRLLNILIVSVDSSFRRRGIACKLVLLAVEEGRRLNCDGLIAEATSYKSQMLCKKYGFERLYILQHSDFLDPVTNQPMFKCKDEGTNCTTLEFLSFDK